MTIRRTLAVATLTGAALVPLALQAQEGGFTLEAAPEKKPTPIYTSSVEVGAGYLSQSSFKLGEYTGLTDQGFYGIGNFLIRERAPYDSDSTRYWEVEGRNLGLDSRELHAEFGKQGEYGVFLEYDEIPHFRFEDAQTPYLGAGGNNLTLPSNWVAAKSTQAMTNLLPDLHNVEIKTERKRINFGLTRLFGPHWKFDGKFHHEHKDGIDTMGAVFGTNGGNPGAMILPYPVDYDTNRLDLSAQYAGRRLQVQFRYELSLFSDGNSYFRFQNPYSSQPSGAPWAPSTGYCTPYPSCGGIGQMATPPDNHANSVTVAAGYNITDTTRMVGEVSWTRMEQNQSFIGYTANRNLTITTPLPRRSLQGLVDNTVVNLVLTSRPLPKFDFRTSYRLDNRDNQTPQDVWIAIANDAENQPTAAAGGLINLPYSYTRQQARLDAGYRVLPSTKFSIGYQYDNDWQNFQEVSTLQEHTFKGRLSVTPFDMVNGWVEYRHGIRTGTQYIANLPYLLSNAPQSPGPNDYENDPLLRKSFLADRTRDSARAVINFLPGSSFGLTLDNSFTNDAYTESSLGLTQQLTISSTVDASYSPNERITGHAFFTYENLQYKQKGCSFRPPFNQDCILNPTATAAGGAWRADTQDEVYTAGVGADWHVIKDRLDLGLDYTFSKGITSIDVSGQGTAPLPDIRSTMNSIGVYANYHIKTNLSARVGYRYESLTTQDYALDGVTPNTISNVLGLGVSSPDYHAHIFLLTLRYQF